MKIIRILAVIMFCATLATPAYAITSPEERIGDPALEIRAEAIAKQIRCVVCQNQSINDSEAEIAKGLRTLIATQLKAGKSDQEIIDYIHDRYGDFVLMKPPVKPATWPLWFGPALIFLLGGFAAMRMMKKRRRAKGRTS